ncbi:MAG: glycosyltransferase family 2 protein [Solobacterium sp.]|nr:glycosyltransferase family 2 protein [Solobacterium sp.]
MSDRLISVVMPVYNCERTIEEAVDSVLSQTYENLELIIVDDCSTDRTVQIVSAIKDPRIRLICSRVNRGASYARTCGIEKASSEWIAFLDGDDKWDREKLEKQTALLAKYPDAVLIFTGSAFMSDDGRMLEYTLHVPEKITYEELLKQNRISCSSVLVRKDMMLKYPFPDINMIHEDFAVWLRILREVRYAYGIDEPLLIYRLSNNSKSSNKIRAALMNWNTYRFTGVPFATAARSMCSYAYRSIRKYARLK